MNVSLLEYPMGLWLLGRHFKDKHRCLVELAKGWLQPGSLKNKPQWVGEDCLWERTRLLLSLLGPDCERSQFVDYFPSSLPTNSTLLTPDNSGLLNYLAAQRWELLEACAFPPKSKNFVGLVRDFAQVEYYIIQTLLCIQLPTECGSSHWLGPPPHFAVNQSERLGLSSDSFCVLFWYDNAQTRCHRSSPD